MTFSWPLGCARSPVFTCSRKVLGYADNRRLKVARKLAAGTSFDDVADEYISKVARDGKSPATIVRRSRATGDTSFPRNGLASGPYRRTPSQERWVGWVSARGNDRVWLQVNGSTLLNESGRWSPDAIERALAHKDRDAVRGTYHRGAHWGERVARAQWWSDHLGELRNQKT